MIGIDLLNNTGIKFIGDESSLKKDEKTLIVVGIARGGTSLVSGSLSHLGIFSGTLSSEPVFEDIRLGDAFERSDFKSAKKIIEEYNNENLIWSFKRPSSINYLNKIHSLCRNPVYFFIFKDIFSVSNRNNISMNLNVVGGLKMAHNEYGIILDFISKKNPNGFLLSYDKIMGNKSFFIESLVTVIGDNSVSDEEKNRALNFIEPNPKEYLDSSRITRGIGQIGHIEKDMIVGWGRYIHSERVAKVELYINSKYVAVVEAKDFRKHLLEKNIHSTGFCGYIFHLNENLKEGDEVSVKLSEDIRFLKNSNQIFQG